MTNIDRLKPLIKWEKSTRYTDHGCNINGLLIVGRCRDAWKAHPRTGEFGSCSCYEILDLAEEILKELRIEYSRLLAIPDLVVKVSKEDWDRFEATVDT